MLNLFFVCLCHEKNLRKSLKQHLVQKSLKWGGIWVTHLAWVMSNGNNLYIFSIFLLNQSKVKHCCKEWNQSGIKLFCYRVISSSVFVSSGQTALASQTPQSHREVGTRKFHSVIPAEQETEEKIDRMQEVKGFRERGRGKKSKVRMASVKL